MRRPTTTRVPDRVRLPRSGQVIVAALLFFLGLGVSLQVKSTTLVQQRLEATQTSLGQMAVLLLKAEHDNAQLAREVRSLNAALAARVQRARLAALLRRELAEARVLAGLTPVTGPGVVVTVRQPARTDGGLFAVHQEDLLSLVNELRAAGAQALSLNGQRLLATTAIRQAGSAFAVNHALVGPPFVLVAVGPPQTMIQALQLPGGVVDTLTAVGIHVQVRAERRVHVPAYTP